MRARFLFLGLIFGLLTAALAHAGPGTRQRALRIEVVLPGKAPMVVFGSINGKPTVDLNVVKKLRKPTGPGTVIVWLPPAQPKPGVNVLLPRIGWEASDGLTRVNGRVTGVKLIRTTPPPRDEGTVESEVNQLAHYAFHSMQIDHVGEDGATSAAFDWSGANQAR